MPLKTEKKVTVVIELQARFDEENNIYYSDLLKDAGARVIFGAQGLKVHSKNNFNSKKSRWAYQAHGISRALGTFMKGTLKFMKTLGTIYSQ